MNNLGQNMYSLCSELFPICRSITGNGVRQTLSILKQHIPELQVHEMPTGTVCFDWTIPKEWNIRDAYVIDPDGNKILSFKESNLHVVGYSTPVDLKVGLEELQQHLYSLPNQPEAIPYVTSYYKEDWGFCIAHSQRENLKPGEYRVYIDSELTDGSLTYGELIITGETKEEIFLSTYICHPSMANNELSGPVVTTFLAKWLSDMPKRRYTYRVVFVPETIGSIAYLSLHLQEMKKRIIAGFNITCVGDDRAYSYLPSRTGNTLSDQIAKHVLGHIDPDYISYTFLERGSDERQYCSPGVDLPVCSVMRTKYAKYPEYHTSLDNLSIVTPSGLYGGYDALQKCLECIESNHILKSTTLCEPQLSKRGLSESISSKKGLASSSEVTSSTEKYKMMQLLNILAYADGSLTILKLADTIKLF